MDADFAFICDWADAGGKLHALGIGIDTIFAPSMPVTHPTFHFVAQLHYSIVESGARDIEIRLMDRDGNDVVPAIRSRVNVPAPSYGFVEGTHRVVVGFTNVTFPAYGSYAVHLSVDGEEMCSVALQLAPPPNT